MLAAAQLSADTNIHTPVAIYDFSDAAYLQNAMKAWPVCAQTPATSGIADTTSIDLEAQAAAAHPEACTTLKTTPLANINQGSTNACSAYAFAQAYTLSFALQHPPPQAVPQLSAVYAYYLQRVEECSTTGVCPCTTCVKPQCGNVCDPPCVDCGSYLLSAATVFKKGVCASNVWPNTTPLNAAPSDAARADAGNHSVVNVTCLPVGADTAAAVQSSLSASRLVVVFLNLRPNQLTWMQSLLECTAALTDSAVQLVQAVAASGALEGHVVVVSGYNASTQLFLIRNSFGFGWGAGGRFTIAAADLRDGLVNSLIEMGEVR
jgi:hypothetical protein